MTSDILEDAKTKDVIYIDIKKKSSYADYLIIATCTSARHINAVSEQIVLNLRKNGFKCRKPEGKDTGNWNIIDAGDVIIHLFRKETRLHYNLEKLWDINFDSVENKLA